MTMLVGLTEVRQDQKLPCAAPAMLCKASWLGRTSTLVVMVGAALSMAHPPVPSKFFGRHVYTTCSIPCPGSCIFCSWNWGKASPGACCCCKDCHMFSVSKEGCWSSWGCRYCRSQSIRKSSAFSCRSSVGACDCDCWACHDIRRAAVAGTNDSVAVWVSRT